MNKHPLRGLGLSVLLGALAAPAAAQLPMTPRALGMGGAYVATARGYEALFVNPANLGLSRTPVWSIALPQVGASSTILGPDFRDLPELSQRQETPQSRRDELLATIPGSGAEVQYDFRAPVAVLQTGRFSIGAAYGSIGGHTVSKDIVELLVNGYEEGRTNYSVGNTSGNRLTYWDFAAGYGQNFGPLSVGVAAHYILGGTAQRSRLFEPRVDIENRDISVDYVSVLARGGSGYSFDVGAALEPSSNLTLSAALANVGAKMTWSEDLRVRDFTLRRSDLDNTAFFDLKGNYEASEKELDPTEVPVRVFEAARGLYDEAYFPTVARLGAEWRPTGTTNLAAGFESHLTEGRLAGRWKQTASVGVQQRLPLITVRAGYATNLDKGNLLSAGLSLGPMQFGAGRLVDGEMEGSDRAGYVFTFGLGIRTKATLK